MAVPVVDNSSPPGMRVPCFCSAVGCGEQQIGPGRASDKTGGERGVLLALHRTQSKRLLFFSRNSSVMDKWYGCLSEFV